MCIMSSWLRLLCVVFCPFLVPSSLVCPGLCLLVLLSFCSCAVLHSPLSSLESSIFLLHTEERPEILRGAAAPPPPRKGALWKARF